MGNSASALPYSIDNQIGAPHDHNGWSLHNGKSTDGRETEVSVFVGKNHNWRNNRQARDTRNKPSLFQLCIITIIVESYGILIY